MNTVFLNNKNILVTGATGLIGSNLVEALLRSNAAQIFITGRNLSKLKNTFGEFQNDYRLFLIEHDASTPIPESIKNIDYIFHAAGPMEREIILNKPINVIFPNIIGIINLLNLLHNQFEETGKQGRIVVFSSVTVYNNLTNENISVKETDTQIADSLDSPTSCYSESKRMTEVIAKSHFKQYNTDIIIARFSTVYGYTKNIPNTAFYEFIKKAIAGDNIILNGNNFPKRDNIYIDDAISGLLTIAEKGKAGESYNISSNGDNHNFASVDEIATIIAEQTSLLTGNPKVEVNVKDSTQRKPGIMLDNSKLKALGWSTKWNLHKAISTTISKILNNV
ncbi:NAD(P)-dependent oxidoreductase [Phocaeicola plebeius]|uniref:NAD-dependent epimerase/dehydratase family protein n=1 Tax=Phocaeicola plebeius TaxID=310297 RepID=UPI0026F18721|nr:NAD(P)-dependent oxidoreductase [Phocaeicola plebeius]